MPGRTVAQPVGVLNSQQPVQHNGVAAHSKEEMTHIKYLNVQSVSHNPNDEVAKKHYYQHTQGHLARAAADGLEMVYQQTYAAAKRMNITQGIVHVADLGSGPGDNSVPAVQAVLRALKARRAEQREAQRTAGSTGAEPLGQLSVMVIHEDLPAIDWHSLFHLLEDQERSYLSLPDSPTANNSDDDADAEVSVFSSCIARSFYERLFPDAYVHLGVCFEALHWQRSKLAVPRSRVTWLFNEGAEPSVRAAAAASAADNLEHFLRLRAAEMVPGGALMISVPGRPAPGDKGPRVQYKGEHQYPVLLPALADMAIGCALADGLVSEEQVAHMVAPAYMPTGAELVEVFGRVRELWTPTSFSGTRQDPEGASEGAGGSDSEGSASTSGGSSNGDDSSRQTPTGRWVIHPAWDRYVAGEITAAQLGEAYAGALRTLLVTICSQGLVAARGLKYDADNVPQDVRAIVQGVLQRLQRCVEGSPVAMAIFPISGCLIRL